MTGLLYVTYIVLSGREGPFTSHEGGNTVLLLINNTNIERNCDHNKFLPLSSVIFHSLRIYRALENMSSTVYLLAAVPFLAIALFRPHGQGDIVCNFGFLANITIFADLVLHLPSAEVNRRFILENVRSLDGDRQVRAEPKIVATVVGYRESPETFSRCLRSYLKSRCE